MVRLVQSETQDLAFGNACAARVSNDRLVIFCLALYVLHESAEVPTRRLLTTLHLSGGGLGRPGPRRARHLLCRRGLVLIDRSFSPMGHRVL